MSTIAENLQKLVDDRDNIAEAIAGKGVEVPENSKLSEFPEMIESISGGGGTAVPSDVVAGKTFSSDAGTELVGTMPSYTDEEIVIDEPDIETKYIFDRFVCVGNNSKAYYSTDGLNWTAMSGMINNYSFTDVAYGNGLFVCISDSDISYYSFDGTTWSQTSLRTRLRNVCHNGTRFISALGNNIYYSDTGYTWKYQSTNLYNGTWYSIIYANGRYIVVGYGLSYYSTDPTNWTAMSGMTSGKDYYSLAYGNDRFVCVGDDSYAYYSTDGETWKRIYSVYGTLRSVAYGNGRFVGVGGSTSYMSGIAYYSTDGEIWTAASIPKDWGYWGVSYGNDRFVCVGYDNKSYYSADGEIWTAMNGLGTFGVAVTSAESPKQYYSYTLPEGYHTSQKILIKK